MPSLRGIVVGVAFPECLRGPGRKPGFFPGVRPFLPLDRCPPQSHPLPFSSSASSSVSPLEPSWCSPCAGRVCPIQWRLLRSLVCRRYQISTIWLPLGSSQIFGQYPGSYVGVEEEVEVKMQLGILGVFFASPPALWRVVGILG